MRRVAGWAAIAGGATMLSLAGAQYAVGAVRQDAARREWNAIQASAAVDRIRDGVLRARPAADPREGTPVARLVIPRLELDEIVLEGVSDRALNGGPGHLPGSVLPGADGNSIVSAHRDRHFKALGKLAIGDTILTEAAGRRTAWVVRETRIVHRDAPALFHSESARLTLTTCWPIRYFGPAPERLIVTAEPVEAP